MKFNHHYNRIKLAPCEINSGEIVVQTANYVPADVIIRRLESGGARLRLSRANFYHSMMDTGNPDNLLPDPTESPDFDFADLTTMQSTIAEKAVTRKANAKKAKEQGETSIVASDDAGETKKGSISSEMDRSGDKEENK